MRLICVVFFWLALTLAAAAQPLASTPFKSDYGGWITVEVYVNGAGPYDFIVDSGATASVIFANLAAEIGEPPLIEAPPRRVIGLSADQRLPLRTIGDIKIGELSTPALQSVMLPDWKAPRATPRGIIGLDILSRYVVEIDTQEQRLNFYAPNRHPFKRRLRRGENLRAVNFPDYYGALYFVDAVISGVNVEMIVDLGASGTIINRTALLESLANATGSRQRATALIGDAFGVENVARRFQFTSLRIGAAQWDDPELVVYDAPVFEQLALTGAPFGLLGVDFFTSRNLILDFPGERIAIGVKHKSQRRRREQ